MRLAVSPELSAWLEARLAAYPAESPEQLRWLAPYVAEFGALPLHVGWLETIGLRPDGDVVIWSTEGDYPGTRAVEDRYLWLTSLVDGAKRHPELNTLLPERTAGARDCWCRAHTPFVEGKIFCPECCGLGWVDG